MADSADMVFGNFFRPLAYLVYRLCGKEKCKAGAFIFLCRGPRSGQKPEGLKGGKSADELLPVLFFCGKA
jgi:hypothetical protein